MEFIIIFCPGTNNGVVLYCMLPPLNDISTFNLRDFGKEEAINNDEYTARIIHYDGKGLVADSKSPAYAS